VWLFFFTYALLAVVYVSQVEDRFLLTLMRFVICLSKHHHHHSSAQTKFKKTSTISNGEADGIKNNALNGIESENKNDFVSFS
jgi:hypothetical protein